MYNNFTDSNELYHCCDVIVPATSNQGRLLVGDFNSATDAQKIKEFNIKTIITAAAGMTHLQVPSHILHITLPLQDSKTENIKSFFEDVNAAIKTNLPKGGVLVHCASGISRSVTLVIAYLMKTRKIGFREAISLVRSKRKNICPNLGFERQLKQYEKQLNSVESKFPIKRGNSQKIGDERRTLYNKNNPVLNEYFQFQLKTADHSVRKRAQIAKKPQHSTSQHRTRDRKNFKIRPLNKDFLYVCGQGPLLKEENLHHSEKITPPVIRTYGKNGNLNIDYRRNY